MRRRPQPIVGTDRTPDNGYFRAKVAQEKLIAGSGIPYTIIRSTQFLDFLGRIADSSADGSTVRISHNAHAFVYVLEGSIVMQVKGGKEAGAGDRLDKIAAAVESAADLARPIARYASAEAQRFDAET